MVVKASPPKESGCDRLGDMEIDDQSPSFWLDMAPLWCPLTGQVEWVDKNSEKRVEYGVSTVSIDR